MEKVIRTRWYVYNDNTVVPIQICGVSDGSTI